MGLCLFLNINSGSDMTPFYLPFSMAAPAPELIHMITPIITAPAAVSSLETESIMNGENMVFPM